MSSEGTVFPISDLAVRVDKLGKMYTLYDQPVDRLKHTLSWRFGKDYGRSFWALKDVSFDIQKGETFGIIGRNGSGKSTLLQILAGTIKESTGGKEINGRVAALLELGSGFNPEFTGRENVLLNGMILGLTRQEALDKFDEIADFADIGEFIDQPVKLYSSGMYVRLAFAIAASVDADVLLIDETLAVGDIFFRQKCYRRLETLRERGVSILLVSHDMNEVEQFCDRGLVLRDGECNFLGSAIEAVKQYYLLQQPTSTLPGTAPSQEIKPAHVAVESHEFWPESQEFLEIEGLSQVSQGLAHCTNVALCDSQGRACLVFQQGQTASFFFEYETLQDIEVPIGGAEIVNEKGLIVHGKNSLLYGSDVPDFVEKGSRVRFRQDITLEIHPGEYTFNVGFSTISRQDFDRRADLPHPDLDEKITVLNILPDAGKFAVVHRLKGRPVEILHFGTANLPGKCQVAIIPPEAFANHRETLPKENINTLE